MTKQSKIITAALLAAVLIAVIMASVKRKANAPFTGSDQTRGMKNNNPLNLRKSHNAWKGKVEGTDKDFETFENLMWGLRAGLRNMRTHYRRGKVNIEQLVTVWAPPHENDTQAYVKYVAGQCGRSELDELEWSKKDIYPLVVAMCQIESRFTPDNDLLDEAWANI